MDEDPLPLSAVEHHAYCPRQAALILVEGLWAENVHTALGSAEHEVVDRTARQERRGGIDTWLSLPVASLELGVAGVCDAVEFHPVPLPVEHKPVRTKRMLGPACQQLAAQAMCLEEMFGVPVSQGVIYAHKENRRQMVEIDEELRSETHQTIRSLTRMRSEGVLPPRVADARCRGCSLREACMVSSDGSLEGMSSMNPFTPLPEGEW